MTEARASHPPLARRRAALLFALGFFAIAALLSAEGARRYLHDSPRSLAALQCEALRDRHDALDRCLAAHESRSRRAAALDVLPGLVAAAVLGAGALVLMVRAPLEEGWGEGDRAARDA